MSDLNLKQKASRIRLLVLDVDGTLTDGGVYIDSNGIQSKKFNIKDGMGITQLREKGIHIGIISHSRSKSILDERARMLGIDLMYSGKESKLQVLDRWLKDLELTYEQVAYIGDDINDLEVIHKAGLSACPHDAHFSVVKEVDIVLQRNGGEGCVREFIDRYLLSL
ncbi:MAG TPA: HAD-IIIA family hydrolase [Saprospiraceae bacterium]|nr:HAD-IIIA family hydrolase [Saprospiraceae bacterium]